MTSSLKARSINAGIWTMAGFGGSQVLRLANNLITTRLLNPSMFGVMAIVMAIMMGIFMFTEMGLRQNIIQSRRGDDPSFQNTTWTIQILRGTFIWLVSILISLGLYFSDQAGWIPASTVYADPRLPWLIPLTNFGVVLSSLEPIWLYTANRNMKMAKVTLIDLTSQTVGMVITLVWIYFDRSIWALAFSNVGVGMVRLLIIYLIVPETGNRWQIEPHALREIIHFGKWLFLSSLLTFLFLNGDRLLLGGLVTARELGIYSVAFFLVNAFSQAAGRLMGNVVFPAISETLRTNPSRMPHTYYRYRFYFDAGLFFVSGFLYEAGHVIVRLIYDARYAPAGHEMEILALSLMAFRYDMASQCFIAFGQPKILSYNLVVRSVALFVSLPLAYHHAGLTGAMWAITASYYSGIPVTLYYKHKLGFLHAMKEIHSLPLLLAGGATGWLVSEFAK